MIYVGIDVGGTGIQVGLVDESGKILCKGGIVTRTDIPFDTQVKAMADCVLGRDVHVAEPVFSGAPAGGNAPCYLREGAGRTVSAD